jgi:hypothetical protein
LKVKPNFIQYLYHVSFYELSTKGLDQGEGPITKKRGQSICGMNI